MKGRIKQLEIDICLPENDRNLDGGYKADLKGEKNPKETQIRLKYLCKLLEALAHLYCDPYMFEHAEQELKKAERLYKDNEDKLSKILYRKFLIKKSSFLKKSGFFIEAYQILTDLRNEIEADLAVIVDP